MYRLISGGVDLLLKSNNVSWSSNIDTLGSQLTFNSIASVGRGAVVSLFNDDLELFRGVVIERTQNRWTWSYVVQDYSRFLKNKVIKQFQDVTATDAITSLLGEAYITGNIVEIPTIITTIYKNKSLSEIIDDILDQSEKDQGIKYFKEIEGDILYVRKLEEMKITPNILLPKEVNIKSSIENMKNRIQIISNSEDNNSIIATAEDTSQQWWYGVLSDMEEVEDKDIAQAQNIANNKLEELNRIESSCSLSDIMCLDSTADSIKSNRMIYLKAGTRLDGYYKVKSATHTLVKGLHKVSIDIEF